MSIQHIQDAITSTYNEMSLDDYINALSEGIEISSSEEKLSEEEQSILNDLLIELAK